MADLKEFQRKMEKTLDVLASDFAAVRAGRANAQVLDRITVEYYGVDTPVGQVGTVSSPDARTLVIQPWDGSLLKAIEKAIQTSDLGINPQNDGRVIRLVFPQLTEERRKDLTKQVRKYAEDSKVAVRNIRRDAVDYVKKAQKKGELTEDERLFYTWTLQSHIDIAKAVWLDYCDGHMLDTIAREPLWQHLINYRCGTGHSVSFVGNVHEGPHALNSRNTTRMRPGMVVTDEPGVYETDLVGIRIENELECIDLGDNQYGHWLGFAPLTLVPIDTTPVLVDELSRDQINWLNDYHAHVYEMLSPRLNETEKVWLKEKCAAIGR